MTNIKARKGFAVATAAAFVVAGITGVAPAQAAEDMTLDVTAGTGYTTLSGSTLTMAANVPSSTPAANMAYIKYRVENAGLISIDATALINGTDNAADSTIQYGTASTAATGGGSSVVTGITDDDFVVDPAAGDELDLAQVSTIAINTNTHAISGSVTVTAWLDLNGNNTIDTAESYSPSRTVSFVPASSVNASVAMVAPLVGDGTLNANVTFTNPDLNVRQIDDGDVLVQFGTVSGSTFTRIESFADNGATGAGSVTANTTVTTKTAATSNPDGNSVTWDSANGVFEAEFTPLATSKGVTTSVLSVSAATTFGAKLFLDNDNNNSVDVTDVSDQEGAISTSKTGADADNFSVRWGVVDSADALNTDVGYEDDSDGSIAATDYTDDQDNIAVVRGGTSNSAASFTYEVFVGTDVTVPVGIKSVPVKITASNGNGLTLNDGVTIDGLSVYSGKDRSITKSTDSTGKVTFEIDGGTAEATDRIDFVLSVNGQAPGASSPNSSKDAEVTWTAADYDIHVANDLSGNGGLSIESGDTFTVDYMVLDQFGQAPANGAYRVIARDKANTSAGRTTAADFAFSQPVVDGKASVSITDDGAGVGSYTLQAGWATTDAAITTGNNDDVDLAVSVVSDNTAATITLDDLAYGSAQLNDANSDGDYSDSGDTDNRTKLVLETESIYTFITNEAAPSESAPTLTSNLEVTVAGTVTNAAGTAVPYATVTLAAPNFLFKTGTNHVMDSITLIADSAGAFSVDVYSASGGVNNITITSGSASATQSLTYAGAVAGAAADFTITTPGASEPGRTVDVTVKVTDKNGNAVQSASVTLSSTGPGYLINTSGTTLKDGTFVTKLLLGANDAGTAIVKATMTINGVEVSKTSTVVVGEGAVAAADKKVNAGSFKGYVAVYAKGYAGQRMSAKIGNDWVIVPSLASNFERVTDLTGAGVDIAVRIYIDRVLIDTINLTTK